MRHKPTTRDHRRLAESPRKYGGIYVAYDPQTPIIWGISAISAAAWSLGQCQGPRSAADAEPNDQSSAPGDVCVSHVLFPAFSWVLSLWLVVSRVRG